MDSWLVNQRVPGGRWLSLALRVVAAGCLADRIVSASPGPGTQGRSLGILVLVVLALLAWLTWAVTMDTAWSMATTGRVWPVAVGDSAAAVLGVVTTMGVAGGLLTDLSPSGFAAVFPYVAVFIASLQLAPRWSAPVAAATVLALVVGAHPIGHPPGGWPQALLIAVGVFLTGVNRRQYRVRAEQAELLLAEGAHARAEEARAAAMAERARIAREIHDVLAHSLAGLTIQLEAARALLADHQDPDRALGHVERAHQLGVEGQAETRRAVATLRDDSPPLHDLLAALVDAQESRNAPRSGGGHASLTVRGEPRNLSPEAALAVYRTAQEALTNVRKHAPGADVDVRLRYADNETVLEVINGRPDGAAPPAALRAAAGGYGLTGMRERAELVGGVLTAGPRGGGWRVELRIPA